MNKQTIFQNKENEKETQIHSTTKPKKDSHINKSLISIKEYALLLLALSAFSGFHMWVYQILYRNGIIEENTRFAINVLMLFVMFTAAIIVAIIAIFREQAFFRPIRKLSEAARKIAMGDFSVRIAPRHKNGKKDFFDLMLDDFNSMTEELETLTEKLKALSVTDELTQLNNRRSFMQYIDTIWKQNHRLKLPITVLILDIDYFKKYNDTLGHLEGDKALKAVAQCLKNQIKRETDFVARFGGEEFVCLLPFLNKNEAMEFAKTLVQSIENLNIPHPKSEISQYITISTGIANTIPEDNNSITQLLENADKALYTAKESGRNRAVMY